MLLIVVIVVLIFFFLFGVMPLTLIGAPFLPSFKRSKLTNIKKVIDFLRQNGCRNRFVDIGSGDGRVVIEFAKKGFQSQGIEINPLLVILSRLQIKRLGLKNAEIIWQNFWKVNFSDFDVIYLFQFNLANKKLGGKFFKELHDGSFVVSVGFPLTNLTFMKREGVFLIYKK